MRVKIIATEDEAQKVEALLEEKFKDDIVVEERTPCLVMLVKPFLYRFVLDLQKADFKSMTVEIIENFVY